MKQIDDITLVAYCDGELDGESAREVEQAVAEDPGLREKVRLLHESASMLSASLNQVIYAVEPLPPLTEKTNVVPLVKRTEGVGKSWKLPLAMAASFFMLGIGGWLGSQMAGHSLDQGLITASQFQNGDLRMMVSAFSEAMEQQPSGVGTEWSNPENGTSGLILPVRTYKMDDGTYCREYTKRVVIKESQTEERGIACRRASGNWQIEAKHRAGPEQI